LLNLLSQGIWWGQNGGGHLYGKNVLQIKLKPEKLRFTWKLPDIVQNKVCLNHGTWGRVGSLMGNHFLYVFTYGKKKTLKIFLSRMA
jgi:hypothetical protein